jgi:pyruvate dehydrogenase E2 component (dihydrolipoamide acetyltransferase)
MSQLVVGQRMQKSKQSIPHFYLQTSANAEPISAAREAASENIVWDAFVVLAVAKALTRYDRICYRFEDRQLLRQDSDAVGVAVSVEDDLYVVPIEDPASKSVEQISREIRSGAEQARRGDPGARKIRPGNITVTNLGHANVETFTAIINPPEAAVLSMGRIKPEVVACDDEIVVQRRVSLVLSVDHRVVNGKYAADFLSAVVEELEKVP